MSGYNERSRSVKGAFATLRPVLRLAPWLLALVGGACATRPALEPAEAERIHRVCQRDIAAGRTLTRRTRDVGTLPVGTRVKDRVVIYGASWCTACHYAVDYLTRYRIPFVQYDVEEDPAANDRMNATLEGAALSGERRLPVIEVRGTVMLGFMPCVVEAAWRG